MSFETQRCPVCTCMMNGKHTVTRWHWFWQRKWTKIEKTEYKCPLCYREEITLIRSKYE